MQTLECPGCSEPFTPTPERPAYPMKVSRDQRRGRRRWTASAVEPVCESCALSTTRNVGGPVTVHHSTTLSGYTDAHTSACEACSLPVRVRADARRRRVYCSADCRAKLYREPVEELEHACQTCGTEFTGRAGAAYCSPACRQKAYRRRHARART